MTNAMNRTETNQTAGGPASLENPSKRTSPPRWKRAVAGVGVALGVALLGGAAIARPFGGPHGPMGGPGMMFMRIFDDLDLTEQQELKAIHIRRTLKEQAKTSHEEMRAEFDQVIAELEKPNPDPAKLHAVVDDAMRRMQKLAHTTVDQYLELHQTLTPEQRETLVQHLKEARDMRREAREDLRKKDFDRGAKKK